MFKSESVSCSVVSDSLQPHGLLYPSRLFCSWYSPGKNTAVGIHFLLQGLFLTQGSNPGLSHCRQILYHLSHQWSKPKKPEGIDKTTMWTLATRQPRTVIPERRKQARWRTACKVSRDWTKLNNIYWSAKISRTPQGKISNIWHPKKLWNEKDQKNMTYGAEKHQLKWIRKFIR